MAEPDYSQNFNDDQDDADGHKNVFKEPLQLCGTIPMTGYDRSGFCRTM